MRVLFITDTIPYPPDSGNRLRVYHLLKQLAREHELWLGAPVRSSEEVDGEAVEHIRKYCQHVHVAVRERYSRLQHVPGLVRYALKGLPPELKFEYSPAFVALIQQITSTVDFDIIHIEPSYLALYREALPRNIRARLVLTYHNVEYSLFQRIARIEKQPAVKLRTYLHSMMLRRWEPLYAEHFDRCIMMSELDRQQMLAANPRLNIHVSPNGVDTEAYVPLPEDGAAPDLLFIGSMNYQPCIDGALFFCQEILPQIRAQAGDTGLWLVGRNPAPEVEALASHNIHVTGWVEDVIPYYRRTLVSVVPLRAGSGTRLKVLEAMALGRAVVSTSIGCEGIDVVDGEHLFIADEAHEFAAKTCRLLQDTELRHRMIARARELVVSRYDWRAIARDLSSVYRDVCREPNLQGVA